jgi:hypothetical protein
VACLRHGRAGEKRCQAVILVVAPDEKVAAWAAEPIDVGLAVVETTHERILTEKDPERLERWLEKAIVAASVSEVIDDPS